MIHNIIYIPVVQCDDGILDKIARYVHELDVDFYRLLSTEVDTVITKIIQSLKDPGSDLGAGYVAFNNSKPVGYVCYFSHQQKMTRNLASLKAMFDFSDPMSREIVKNTKKFHDLLAPINTPCFYLNKIIVFKEHAGKSIGSSLFIEYLKKSNSANLPPLFHVKSDNEGAIQFYSKHGFHAEQSGLGYLLCKQNQI